MNWKKFSTHELDTFTISHKYRKRSSVMSRVIDSQASHLGSILDQVHQFYCKSFFLYSCT